MGRGRERNWKEEVGKKHKKSERNKIENGKGIKGKYTRGGKGRLRL